MLTSIFPMGGSGGGELKAATGTVSSPGFSPRNVFKVTGLGFKPGVVYINRQSGSDSSDVQMCFVSSEAGQYSVNYAMKVSSYEFLEDGFSITIGEEWGWGSCVHRWYAYYAG